MDPNAALDDIRSSVGVILNGRCEYSHYGNELALEVDSLLTWLANGGFAPDWSKYDA